MGGKVDRESLVPRDDLGADLVGQAGRDRVAAAEIPGPVAVEEVQPQAGADVDAVQLVGVLVAELAGDQSADVAACGRVPVMTQHPGHQAVPDVGDLPEVHVGVRRQWCGESEPR
jgi:hypothetical protein